MATLSIGDLGRDPLEVARGSVEWQRGDREEAVLKTLALSGSRLHDRHPVVWIWAGRSPLGDPVWVLPVRATELEAWGPRGAARAVAACVEVAVRQLEVAAASIRAQDWRGRVALVLPGLLEELAEEGFAEVGAFAGPAVVRVTRLPPDIAVQGAALALSPGLSRSADGIARMGRELHRHPFAVAVALAGQNYPVDIAAYSPELVTAMRAQGLGEAPPPEPERGPSLRIEDDPCPRRRHARTVLQRMLRMGKVGPGYHTEFDHFARGAAAHDRRQALEVGAALLRAGMLIEKPSVGQRHISLNVRALPAIHALIERGETSDPQLAAHWTAPAPAATARPPTWEP